MQPGTTMPSTTRPTMMAAVDRMEVPARPPHWRLPWRVNASPSLSALVSKEKLPACCNSCARCSRAYRSYTTVLMARQHAAAAGPASRAWPCTSARYARPKTERIWRECAHGHASEAFARGVNWISHLRCGIHGARARAWGRGARRTRRGVGRQRDTPFRWGGHKPPSLAGPSGMVELRVPMVEVIGGDGNGNGNDSAGRPQERTARQWDDLRTHSGPRVKVRRRSTHRIVVVRSAGQTEVHPTEKVSSLARGDGGGDGGVAQRRGGGGCG